MQIGWRTKAAAFRLFDAMPAGRHLYYLAQRHVTRTLPRDLSEHRRWAVAHANAFRARYDGDLGRARLFEFGAGWDLFNSLVQWCFGVNRQLVVDVVRWARADQINHAIRYLRDNPPPSAHRLPATGVDDAFEASLSAQYGIEYRAPSDARATALDTGGIDLICTTSVLEHVPPAALHEIMRECHRISRPGAISSHVVDYSDHYAHSDRAITPYNFLRFADRDWSRYNPALHYQNRLRHFEYGEIFEQNGFAIVSETATEPKHAGQLLAHVPLSDRFRGMPPGRLTPTTGHWVLRRG